MAETKWVSYDTIVSALEGDDEALNYIIAFYLPRIRAIVRAIGSGLSAESQEDCVQEICIRYPKGIDNHAHGGLWRC